MEILNINQAWCFVPIMPALRMLTEGYYEFKKFGCLVRPFTRANPKEQTQKKYLKNPRISFYKMVGDWVAQAGLEFEPGK